ncbi:hypothetical protein SUDANB171_03398 [Streptomyces sp. enrichment culture]
MTDPAGGAACVGRAVAPGVGAVPRGERDAVDVPAVASAAGDVPKGVPSARAGEPPRGAADGAVPVARWTGAAGPGPGWWAGWRAPVAGAEGGVVPPVARWGADAGAPLPRAVRVGGTTGEGDIGVDGEALADR